MWCRIETVTKSAPESRVRCCCCGVAVAVLLLLMCCCCCAVVADVLLFLLLCCAAVMLLCVRVRGEIVGFVGKRTTANAFAKDVSLIKNEGQGIEDMNRHRLNHRPCRPEDGRRQFL